MWQVVTDTPCSSSEFNFQLIFVLAFGLRDGSLCTLPGHFCIFPSWSWFDCNNWSIPNYSPSCRPFPFFLSLKKGRNPRCNLPSPSTDPAWLLKFLQHFGVFFVHLYNFSVPWVKTRFYSKWPKNPIITRLMSPNFYICWRNSGVGSEGWIRFNYISAHISCLKYWRSLGKCLGKL